MPRKCSNCKYYDECYSKPPVRLPVDGQKLARKGYCKSWNTKNKCNPKPKKVIKKFTRYDIAKGIAG
jgi:hypothetical protein